MQRILIIDYKVGNCDSIANSLKQLGYNFNISGKTEDIIKADTLILPGVGAFPEAMKNLRNLDILKVLNEQVLVKKKPILGICLGMQILTNESEEGEGQGLGWIEGKVIKFKENSIRIPHVGWNDVQIIKNEPMFTRVSKNANFYFDHSFYFTCPNEFVAARCNYGANFAAAVQKENIFGVQFHPEKSQTAGLKLFRSFFSYTETLC